MKVAIVVVVVLVVGRRAGKEDGVVWRSRKGSASGLKVLRVKWNIMEGKLPIERR